MGIVIDFPKKTPNNPENQFITVLFNDITQILWNQSQLFYIKNLKDPSKNEIKAYASISTLKVAHSTAKWIEQHIVNGKPAKKRNRSHLKVIS